MDKSPAEQIDERLQTLANHLHRMVREPKGLNKGIVTGFSHIVTAIESTHGTKQPRSGNPTPESVEYPRQCSLCGLDLLVVGGCRGHHQETDPTDLAIRATADMELMLQLVEYIGNSSPVLPANHCSEEQLAALERARARR
jgi:hypothetical protein